MYDVEMIGAVEDLHLTPHTLFIPLNISSSEWPSARRLPAVVTMEEGNTMTEKDREDFDEVRHVE